jgi:hypothetical protein
VKTRFANTGFVMSASQRHDSVRGLFSQKSMDCAFRGRAARVGPTVQIYF